jgi:predicted metalloprotease
MPPYGRVPPYGGARPGYPPPYAGPPQAGPPPYGQPWQGPHQRYAMPMRRRPPRRSAAGSVVAALGALATIFVAAVLVISVFGDRSKGTTTIAGSRSGPRSTRAQATDSKLYGTGALTSVNCRLPRIVQGDTSSMKTFMDELTGCLDRTWRRQFGKAGLGFAAPERMFWTQPGSGACGSYPAPGAAAFYCPANQTMYVGLQHVIETAGNEPVSHYAVYARVIAHEYGHHVQDQGGILDYGHQLMSQSGVDARDEASRRIELQAQCLAGAFLGSEKNSLPMTREQTRYLLLDVRGRGDDNQPTGKHDHGSSRHYAGWVVTGYTRQVLSACNTWAAPSSAVS